MTEPSTDLWIAWTTRHDESAFEALVRPELPHAMSFARRLGCGEADAEDALQEALVRLASTGDGSPAEFGVRAWLCRQVHGRARSNLRAERRRRTREAAVAVLDRQDGPDGPVALRDEIETALAGLQFDERMAVELRYLHDLDYREMAFVLGATEGACRKRVHRALERLRRRIGEGAAAFVAALPLGELRDTTALMKAATAKAAAGSVAGYSAGGVLVTTTTKKVAAAVLAALLLLAVGSAVVSLTRRNSPSADARVREFAATQSRTQRLRVRHEDSASPEKPSVTGPGFAFPESAFAAVRVLDASGSTMPGAVVRLFTRTMRSTPIVVATRTTDGAGVARFDRLKAHEGALFEADARSETGFADIKAVEVGSVTVLTLEAASAVHITVTRDGAPASAHVWIDRWDDRGFFNLIEERDVGDGGRDTVALPTSGRIRFAAMRPDGVSETVEIRGGASTDVALVIPSGLQSVRIETKQGRAPVPDVDVWFGGVAISTKPTDAQGRTRIGSIPAIRLMEVSIRRGALGISTPLEEFQAEDGTIVLRIDDSAAQARLSLVRVVGPDGHPLQGVSVGWSGRVGVAGLGQSFTDAEGKTYGLCWPGVFVAARGYRIAPVALAPGENEIQLEPAKWRRVRVVDGVGGPVANAWMSFARVFGKDRANVVLHAGEDGVAEFIDEPEWQVSVRAPGAFWFTDGVDLGTGDVDVVWRPKADIDLAGSLVLPDGATSERFVLTLLSGPQPERHEIGRQFSFKVHSSTFVGFRVESVDGSLVGDYTGAPSTTLNVAMHTNFRIRFSVTAGTESIGTDDAPRLLTVRDGGEPRSRRVVSDGAGVWSVDVDQPGAWDVFVQRGDKFGVARAQVGPASGSGDPVAVKVARGGSLLLRLDTTTPVSDVAARFAIAPEGADSTAEPFVLRRRDAVIDDAGRVRVDGLVPGRYDVVVTSGRSMDGARIAFARGAEVVSGAQVEVRPDGRTIRRIALAADGSGRRYAGLRVVPVGDLAWTRRLLPSLVLEEAGREFLFAWDGEFSLSDKSGALRFRVVVTPGDTSATVLPQ